jgi:hypothetical protein
MQEAPQSGSPGGDVGQLIASTDQGLSALAEMLAGTPDAPEGAAQAMAELAAGFKDLVGALSGGAPKKAQAPQGPSSPEAGGNPNARPMGV